MILLGRKSDKEPATCCVCGRRARGIGVTSRTGTAIGWLCEDIACIEGGQKVANMSAKSLDVFEQKAIDKAADAVLDDIAEALLNAMWANKIRSLDQLDGEAFPKVAETARTGPEYRRALAKFLTEYGAAIRSELQLPPF